MRKEERRCMMMGRARPEFTPNRELKNLKDMVIDLWLLPLKGKERIRVHLAEFRYQDGGMKAQHRSSVLTPLS